MSSPNPGTLNIRARTRQVVDHHYDNEKPGKPLYLLSPGGRDAAAQRQARFRCCIENS